MPNYQDGKLYRILQDGVKTVYIGSTTQTLSQRMAQHRKGLKHWPNMKLYQLMAQEGVDHFSIELLVDCPCDRREQLHRAEGEQIRLHNTIGEGGCNSILAGRTAAEYALLPERKAKMIEYKKKPETKTKIFEYEQHQRPKVKSSQKEYREEYFFFF